MPLILSWGVLKQAANDDAKPKVPKVPVKDVFGVPQFIQHVNRRNENIVQKLYGKFPYFWFPRSRGPKRIRLRLVIKGRSELKIGIVSAVSKKGTVKLGNYGRFSAVVRIIKCNDSIGNFGERDSIKKPRSRTESSVKEYHSSLSTNNTFTSSRWERLRNGLIRRARNLILSISSLIRMSLPYVKVI